MRWIYLLVTAIALSAAAVVGYLILRPANPAPLVTPLYELTDPAWTGVLGGEGPIASEQYRQLNETSGGLPAQSAAALRNVATTAALSNLTSTPYGYAPYDTPDQLAKYSPDPRCSKASLLAASPVTKDYLDGTWARVLVAYSGTCKDGKYTKASPGVEYVYAQLTDSGWVPRRPWQTPGAGQSIANTTTDPSALVEMGPCGVVDDRSFLARPRVAVAFDRMCKAAAADGTVLVISSAYRTREEQKDLYDQAVESYGSAAAASAYVAFADDKTCTSKHCTGLAVGVEPDSAATTWLASPTACLGADGSTNGLLKGSCPSNTRIVTHAQEYGFATPPKNMSGYLEFVLPAGLGGDYKTAADCSPYGESVPGVIAAVFRCRLGQAGVPVVQIEKAVASAEAVARCASGLNPQALVFNGAYANSEKPGTGRTFPMGGLFGMTPSSWLTGSIADPVAAANYAAKVWLSDRSFSRFFCATGKDPDLKAGPVLPEYNGPSIPAWAYTW